MHSVHLCGIGEDVDADIGMDADADVEGDGVVVSSPAEEEAEAMEVDMLIVGEEVGGVRDGQMVEVSMRVVREVEDSFTGGGGAMVELSQGGEEVDFHQPWTLGVVARKASVIASVEERILYLFLKTGSKRVCILNE